MDHSQSFDPLTHTHYVYIIICTRDECQCKSPLVQLENILFYNSLTSLSPLQTQNILRTFTECFEVKPCSSGVMALQDPCRLSTAPQKQTDSLTESPCVRSVSEAVSRTSRAVMTLMALKVMFIITAGPQTLLSSKSSAKAHRARVITGRRRTFLWNAVVVLFMALKGTFWHLLGAQACLNSFCSETLWRFTIISLKINMVWYFV